MESLCLGYRVLLQLNIIVISHMIERSPRDIEHLLVVKAFKYTIAREY